MIEYLLERSKFEAGPSYIKTLRDVKELNLVNNPGFIQNQIEKGNEFIDSNRSKWICSITGLEMSGCYKFYYLYSCGCVISERALKSMQSTTLKCLSCDKPYADNDLIIINPNEEDLSLNQEKYNNRKSAAKLSKQLKSTEDSKSSSLENLKSSSASSLSTVSNENKKLATAISSFSTSKSADLASGNHHKRSHTQSEKAASLDNKDAKRSKSIQDDPNTSSVYKSLFTSCDKAKNQQKAHWVTFNPQYF